MLYLRQQLGDGAAVGVGGENLVEGAFLCTLGSGWILLGGLVWGYLLLRVRFCAPSGRIVVAVLGVWWPNCCRGCIPVLPR